MLKDKILEIFADFDETVSCDIIGKEVLLKVPLEKWLAIKRKVLRAID